MQEHSYIRAAMTPHRRHDARARGLDSPPPGGGTPLSANFPWMPTSPVRLEERRIARNDPGSGVAVVCGGKKCVRACEHDALVRSLCKVGSVQVVRCQKICHGSVVGALLDGRLEWFERIDTARLCVAMKKAVARGSRQGLPASLKKRRIKSLRGRSPR
jgi:hypothetical protein